MNILTIYEQQIGTYDKQLVDNVIITTDEELTYEHIRALRLALDERLYGLNEEDEEWNEYEVRDFAEDFLEKNGYKITRSNTEQSLVILSGSS